jgi:23S rRNA (guanosine2251-2'-O)-methyltransferase
MGTQPAFTGYHAIEEALRRPGARGILYLAGERKRNRALRELAAARGIRTEEVSQASLAAYAGTEEHRGAVFVSELASEPARTDLRSELGRLRGEPRLVLVLDHVLDPQNLGAILRSADQFGVDLVVIPERRAAQLTPAVARASAGASAHVRLAVVGNVVSSMRLLKDQGFWVYGAHLEGERLDRVRFAGRTAVVMGAEGRGLSELVARECDALARIPSTGHVDSLNVSVAAGILLYEARRGQGFFDPQPPISSRS